MKRNNHQKAIEKAKLKTPPFFTVVITTYNRADLLTRAIQSLLSQTEKDWEAVIIDDESTDDTYSKISSFLKSDSKIQYVKHSHRGEALSKNAGIEIATGRFITFLDSDDEFDPTHLESRKSLLQENPHVKFLYGGVKIIGNQFVPDRYDYEKKINLNECVIGGTFFIERDTIISLKGLKNILIGADADLFDRMKMAHIISKQAYLPTYIYHHETEDSITNRLFLTYNYS
jgi:glycosyltransferase involved in cell wall biosynthesis